MRQPPYTLAQIVSTTVLLLASSSSHALQAGCSASPEQAADRIASGKPSVAGSGGYRLTGVRWDPLLQRRWAVVVSCERPDRPATLVPLHEATHLEVANASPPVVHAGEPVHITWREKMLRIELAGIAEENGAIGTQVRVHLQNGGAGTFGSGPGQAGQTLKAVVLGTHQVEIAR